MPLYKITIKYNGLPYFGWQKQKNLPTIQNEIEIAINKITGKNILIYGASRTDAKVHSLGQTAHFSINKIFLEYDLQSALNHHLIPKQIIIVKTKIVSNEFHARHNKKTKIYQYKIFNSKTPPSLENGLAWHVKKPLNTKKMQQAARYLVGKYNFSSFKAKNCQAKSSILTLDKIKIKNIKNNLITIDFEARSFIYKQIRIIVGTLVKFGYKQQNSTEIKKILTNKNRKLAGVTAPGYGLYLKKITYIP